MSSISLDAFLSWCGNELMLQKCGNDKNEANQVKRLLFGPSASLWLTVTQRVRQAETVKHIRKNIKINKMRDRNAKQVPSSASLESRENQKLANEVTQARKQMEKLDTQAQEMTQKISRMRLDNQAQIKMEQNLRAKLDLARKMARILVTSAKKTQMKVANTEDLVEMLAKGKAFRLEHKERWFEKNDTLKNAAQNAYDECVDLISNLIFENESLTPEVGQRVEKAFEEIGADEIGLVFGQQVAKEIREIENYDRSNKFNSPSFPLTSYFNPSNDLRSSTSLLMELAAKHVRLAKESDDSYEEMRRVEDEIQLRIKRIKDSFSQYLTDPYLLTVHMRHIMLQLAAHQARSTLQVILQQVKATKEVIWKSQIIQQEEKTRLESIRRNIGNNIALVCPSIEELMSLNICFGQIHLDYCLDMIKKMIFQDLIPLESDFTNPMETELKDLPVKRMNSMLTIKNLDAFQTTKIVKNNIVRRVQTSSLSLHRLRLTPFDHGLNSFGEDSKGWNHFINNLCRIVDVNPMSNPMYLMQRIVEKKIRNSEIVSWLESGRKREERDHPKDAAKRLKNLLVTLSSFEFNQQKKLLPIIQNSITKIRQITQDIKTVNNVIKR